MVDCVQAEEGLGYLPVLPVSKHHGVELVGDEFPTLHRLRLMLRSVFGCNRKLNRLLRDGSSSFLRLYGRSDLLPVGTTLLAFLLDVVPFFLEGVSLDDFRESQLLRENRMVSR